MKNNVLKSIFFVVALFAIGSVCARAIGEKKRPAEAELKGTPPAKRQRIEQPAPTPQLAPVKPAATTATAQPQAIAGGAAGAGVGAAVTVQQPALTPEQIQAQKAIQAKVDGFLRLSQWDEEAERNRDRDWDLFSADQQKLILNKERELLKKKESVTKPFAAAEEKREEEKGWFASLFDSQSYITQLTSQIGLSREASIAATSVLGGIALLYSAPAVLAYLGYAGVASLAATKYAYDQVAFSVRTGTLTTEGAIEATKQLLEQQISDSGKYPTYDSKIEALQGRDFMNISKIDNKIFNEAKARLLTQIQQNKSMVFSNIGEAYQKEKVAQDMINAEIEKIRATYKSGNLTQYVKELEAVEYLSWYRAVISELERAKTIIGETAAQKLEQKIEEKKAAVKAAEEKPYFTMGG